MEHLLDTAFSPAAVRRAIGDDGRRRAVAARHARRRTWSPTRRTARRSPVASSPTTRCTAPGTQQYELRHGKEFVLGIHHYVRMRYDSAREQLDELRRRDPVGSSGASFAALDLATA